MSQQATSPVLFLVFNRPETTRRVFEAIRAARPRRLYVAADGPRPDRPDDAPKCQQVRELIGQGLDWDCQLFTHYREQNLGCRDAVSEGITWFFEHEEMGIILEDDCLPHPDFFGFCQDMLSRYAADERVMLVSGFNPIEMPPRYPYDIFFVRISSIWGWASWRRAWKKFENECKIDEMQNLRKRLASDFHYRLLLKSITETFNKTINSWDYIWAYAIMSEDGLCLASSANLVGNIGFGEDATHTIDVEHVAIPVTEGNWKAARFPIAEIDEQLSRRMVLAFESRSDGAFERIKYLLKKGIRKIKEWSFNESRTP